MSARSPPSASIPTNPDIVYVAAQGNPFVANKDRGVYRTTDGGKTWKQVFFRLRYARARPISNCSPAIPNVVFACMWHAQRKPWTIISGAMEGGIYKSTDGGDNWTKLAGGLPNDLFGRSNVAISSAMPNRIYALDRSQARLRPVPLRRRRRHVGPR